MKTTYWTTQRSDGGVDVETRGPFDRFIRAFRIGFAVVFIAGAIGALIAGQWAACAVSLIIGGLVLPKLRNK